MRVVARLLLAAALVALSAWWVVAEHAFAGPVVVPLSGELGVHAGDLPVLGLLAVAGWSLRRAATRG